MKKESLHKSRRNLSPVPLVTVLILSATAVIYGLASYAMGGLQVRFPDKQERYKSKTQSAAKALNNDSLVLKILSYPYTVRGIVNWARYDRVRQKAFEIAGIDESNLEHDEKRFRFYRDIGVAVRQEDDDTHEIYICFEDLRTYIQKNSDFKIKGWENWKDNMPETGRKKWAYLLGKVFYKADSSSQGGNEDGVVDNKEWNLALNKMGHYTMDDLLSKLQEDINDSDELRGNPDAIIDYVFESVKKHSDTFVDVDVDIMNVVGRTKLKGTLVSYLKD